jgi:hypothetical protein
VIVGLGILAIPFLPGFQTLDALHDVMQKVGGGFISCLSAFPLKEYLARRDRLRILTAVDKQIADLRLQAAPSDEDVNRIRDLVWGIYKKGVGA